VAEEDSAAATAADPGKTAKKTAPERRALKKSL
jgi:hypothetical protein